MAGFTIDKLDYANETSGANQTWKFEYKLPNDPETAYITIVTTAVNSTTKIPVNPVSVSGLPANTSYYVRATNMCNELLLRYVQIITTNQA